MTDFDWFTVSVLLLVVIAAVVWKYTNPDREEQQ